MNLRAPAYPLVTVDPYFSLWSMSDKLNESTVNHWTGKPNTLIGTVTVDGTEKLFMGKSDREKIEQISVDVDAFTTTYQFSDGKILLTVRFTTPLLPDDLNTMTRPVSYMAVNYQSVDGESHDVSVTVLASEELVMNKQGDDTVEVEKCMAGDIPCAKMGKTNQQILNRSGDDLRIEWGYFYLAVPQGEVSSFRCPVEQMTYVMGKADLLPDSIQLFMLAYDDIESMVYFGDHLKSVWNADGTTIEQAIVDAYEEYELLNSSCLN